jgi:hypothetical protein
VKAKLTLGEKLKSQGFIIITAEYVKESKRNVKCVIQVNQLINFKLLTFCILYLINRLQINAHNVPKVNFNFLKS